MDRIVDARDSFCPGPLMELITAMKSSEVGERLEVLSTDQASIKEISDWIESSGHEMIGVSKGADGLWHSLVRKSK